MLHSVVSAVLHKNAMPSHHSLALALDCCPCSVWPCPHYPDVPPSPTNTTSAAHAHEPPLLSPSCRRPSLGSIVGDDVGSLETVGLEPLRCSPLSSSRRVVTTTPPSSPEPFHPTSSSTFDRLSAVMADAGSLVGGPQTLLADPTSPFGRTEEHSALHSVHSPSLVQITCSNRL